MAWGEGVFQQLGIFFNPSSLPVPVTVCCYGAWEQFYKSLNSQLVYIPTFD